LKPLATPLSNTNKPISYYHCMLTMNWRHEEQNTVVNPLTCRCSNGSPRPHRCCSVANKVENIDRRQVWVCPTITRPRKNCPSCGGSRPHEPRRKLNCTSIGSAVLQCSCLRVTDRCTQRDTQTDHATRVTIGRILC